jgi:hypothetical protein
MVIIIIVIFLSSIRFIETCYRHYKTESFHLFKGERMSHGLTRNYQWFLWNIGNLVQDHMTSEASHHSQTVQVNTVIVPQNSPHLFLNHNFQTKRCGQVVSAPTLYSGGLGFKSWPKDQFSWLRFLWFSSVPPGCARINP